MRIIITRRIRQYSIGGIDNFQNAMSLVSAIFYFKNNFMVASAKRNTFEILSG